MGWLLLSIATLLETESMNSEIKLVYITSQITKFLKTENFPSKICVLTWLLDLILWFGMKVHYNLFCVNISEEWIEQCHDIMNIRDKQYFRSGFILLLFPEEWHVSSPEGNSPYPHRSAHMLYESARARLQ